MLALAGKVSWTPDPSPPPTTQYKGAVSVETVGGRRETAEIAHNRGSRENPMTRDDLVAKFHACARSLSARQRRRIIDTVLALETVPSIEEVVSECT